jgi:hypothetical protein
MNPRNARRWLDDILAGLEPDAAAHAGGRLQDKKKKGPLFYLATAAMPVTPLDRLA